MNVAFPAHNGLRELQRVRLLGQYTSGGGLLQSGAEGTIVYRHRDGEAFEVEFPVPVGTVITLKPDEIVAIDG